MEGLKQRITRAHKQANCQLDMGRLKEETSYRQPANSDWMKAKIAYLQAAELAKVGQVIDLDQYQL